MNPERIADSHGWRHSVRLLDLQIDNLTAYAFDELEAHGLRFLVHFGIDNAVEMAIKQWFNRMQRAKS